MTIPTFTYSKLTMLPFSGLLGVVYLLIYFLKWLLPRLLSGKKII